MVTDVLAVAFGNETSFQWTSRDVDVINRGGWWSRSDDPSGLDDSTLLFWCQAVDVNFTVVFFLSRLRSSDAMAALMSSSVY